jgi:uncharacterized protein (DUF1501 family)
MNVLTQPRLTRRAALLGLTSAWALGRSGLALAAAPTDHRFVVVILRGALDGMSAVTPYGDRNLGSWRAELVPPGPGSDGGLLDLGGFYGLHPALGGMHRLYAASELMPVHAVAGHYRSRSHFEAQDYMESGADERMTSGWLNRVVAAIPPAGARETGVSLGIATPLLMRGPAAIGSYAPEGFAQPDPDLYARMMALNHDDPVLGPSLTEGLKERGFVNGALVGADQGPKGARNGFPALATIAGRMLAKADGPRIAALEIDGWDTHAAQLNRLHGPLGQLDAGMVALRDNLGDAWKQTVVLTMTEFGRTVRVNGTKGTDHGTGTVAFVAGGAVQGGRVLANWPGLAQNQLFENRDLAPTMDLRALAKGLLVAHLGLAEPALARIFPNSSDAAPVKGLLRA